MNIIGLRRTLIVFGSICVIPGCSPNEKEFVDEWVTLDQTSRIELFQDGTGRMVLGGEPLSLSWSVLPDRRAKLEVKGVFPQTTISTLREGVMIIDEQVKGFSSGVSRNTSFIRKENLQKGKWITWHPNGIKATEGNIRDGKIDGLYHVWDESGILAQEANSKEGEFHGVMKRYFPSGKISFEQSWKNGKLDGRYLEWDEKGFLSSESTFKDGLRDGEEIRYFNNAKVLQKLIWENGVLFGVKTYYPDGGNFADAMVDTKGIHSCTFYYPNGDPAGKIGYTQSDSGEVKLVHPHYDSNYLASGQVGNDIVYTIKYPSGEIFHTAKVNAYSYLYKDSKFFYQNGGNLSSYLYQNGEVESIEYWDSDGERVFSYVKEK